MQDGPTIRELLSTVAQFLDGEISPTLSETRLRFRAHVAANVLSVLARELELGPLQLRAEYERLGVLLPDSVKVVQPDSETLALAVESMTGELARRIRAGQADEGAFHDAVRRHVRQTVIEKLQIGNPRYLERVGATIGE